MPAALALGAAPAVELPPVSAAAEPVASAPQPGAPAPLADYAMTLEYDGTAFSGWQRQPGRRTVEGALLTALAAATGERPPLTAAGRTDAGAHAHGQVVGCRLGRAWDPAGLGRAVNAHLPGDVAVVAAAATHHGFHARFDALRRTYVYVISPRRRAVGRHYSWSLARALDEDAMDRAARRLVGRHDLGAFGRSPRPGGPTVRSVHAAGVRRVRLPWPSPSEDGVPDGVVGGGATARRELGGSEVVVVEVTADAFLRGMMRAVVGALVAVGCGRLTEDELASMVEEGRQPARVRPAVAPACGLHQWRVVYPVRLPWARTDGPSPRPDRLTPGPDRLTSEDC